MCRQQAQPCSSESTVSSSIKVAQARQSRREIKEQVSGETQKIELHRSVIDTTRRAKMEAPTPFLASKASHIFSALRPIMSLSINVSPQQKATSLAEIDSSGSTNINP